MSDLDIAAPTAASSTPDAPPPGTGEPQVSSPASVDTTAIGQDEPKTEQVDKPSRRDSRAFATLRRENRELSRQIGYLQAQFEANRPPPQQQTEGEPQRQQRQPTPEEVNAARRNAEAMDALTERLEDGGDDEEVERVMATITAPNFPGTVAMRDFLMETDKPGPMAKWLADNLKEARRISLLSDVGQWKALEKAEAKLAAAPAPKRTTQAPAPLSTVGGSSRTSVDPQTGPRNGSMDDYATWRKRA